MSPLLTQTVIIAVEHGLVDFDVLGIDSLKIRANASYKQDRTLLEIEKEEVKIKIKINELLDKISNEGSADNGQLEVLEKRKLKVARAKVELVERIKQSSEQKSESEKAKISKEEKINITDHDAHRMQQRNGEINPSYSTTITVDTKTDIITHFQTNLKDNDAGALIPAIKGSAERSSMALLCMLHNILKIGRSLNPCSA